MTLERGIVRPVRSKRSPELGPLAILAATQADFTSVRKRLNLPDTRPLFISRLCYDSRRQKDISLVGPVTGSPYSAMLVETLRAWGARRFIFYGWCGSIQASLAAGDIVVARSAIVDEGTSLHYQQPTGAHVSADADLADQLCHALGEYGLAYQDGPVWTTDAIFRETPGKIQHFGNQGALAVEMEVSALFSVALFYNMRAAAILVVSDELATLKWRPGFRDAAFKQSRSAVCELLSNRYGAFESHGH